MRHQLGEGVSAPAPLRKARVALPSAGYALLVDGQAKSDFKTRQQALEAARDLKGRIPKLQIKVYDAERKMSELVEL